MNYYCQARLDERPDCRTWDACHRRGICLAKKSPEPDRFPIFHPISKLQELKDGTGILIREYGKWHISVTRKQYGYTGGCDGFYILDEIPWTKEKR